MKYVIIFENLNNANWLLKNTSFSSSHEIKAFIPASNTECTKVIKFMPSDLTCKHLFYKLIISQYVLSVRRFRLPKGFPLQSVSLIFASNILPAQVSCGLCTLPVEKYIKPVLQCYKCKSFSHTTKYYKSNVVCLVCSQEHLYKDCTNVNKDNKDILRML